MVGALCSIKRKMRQVGVWVLAWPPYRMVLSVLSVGSCGSLGTCSVFESFETFLPFVIPQFPYLIK